MASSTQCEIESHASGEASPPCGHAKRSVDVSVFSVPFLAPNPKIECGACHQADRPLWWGICAWCGADEDEFETAA